jgi:hypothetical protein
MPIKKTFDVLSVLNRHSRDEKIVFQEEGHKYIIDGDSSGWISATSLLSKLHEPFDTNKAVDALMKGAKYKSGEHPLSGKGKEEIKNHWKQENHRGTALHARMEYTMNKGIDESGNESERKSGAEGGNVSELETISGMFVDGSHSILHCTATKRVYILDTENDDTYFLGYLWEDGTVRRNTESESELGGDEPVLEYKEAIAESCQVRHFWESNPHLEPYRAEWMIWNREYKIAGTMDAVFYDKTDGTYWIYDWKRVQSGLEADLEATRYGYVMDETEWLQPVNWYTKKMNGPASELYDTKYWHYCLQLNLYRYILEKDYGLKIKGMVLVQFHPSLGQMPKYHRVVFLDSPITKVLKEREEDLTRFNRSQSRPSSHLDPVPELESVKVEETKEADEIKGEAKVTATATENDIVVMIDQSNLKRVRKNKGQLTPSSTIKRTMITRSMAQTTLQFNKIQ